LLDGLIKTKWLRMLIAYPLVWLGLWGLGVIVLASVMSLLGWLVLETWSLFAG